MYDHDPGCSCGGMDREIYRGDIYDICRARLGHPHDQVCMQLKCLLLGAVITAAVILFTSCCLK